jgi:radical SAM superfamily enzyme YgiQ (UPF0313 family)
MTNEMILEAGLLLRKHNIRLATYNMIGLPTETPEEAFETIRLNAKLKPTKINEFIFQPYPHTDLFQNCMEWGLYDGKTHLPDNWRKTTVLKQEQFPTEQVIFLNRYFKVLVKLLSLAEELFPGAEPKVNDLLRREVLERKWLTKALNRLHSVGFSSMKFFYVKILRGLFNRRTREFSPLQGAE